MRFVENIRADLKDRGSNWRREVVAGTSSFLSLAYIFVVNPSILGNAGMDPQAVLFATVVASGLATIVMGLYARLPFVLAPGLEMNAYVAFVVVGAMGLSWQEGLGVVFWSGALFFALSLRGVRQAIIESIPDPMKFSLAMAVGAFVFTIGMSLAGVLVYEGVDLRGLGALYSAEVLVLFAGIGIIALFQALKVPAGVLVSIILCAAIAGHLGLGMSSMEIGRGNVLGGVWALDLVPSRVAPFVTALIILFLVDFYGSVAKFVGMTMNTTICQQDERGKWTVPRSYQGLMVDGVGTMVGATLGTTSVTTYVESAVGIAAGGRTGLTAIVAGTLMLLVIFLVPWIQYVPVVATTGALVYVAWKLIPRRETLELLGNKGEWGLLDKIVFWLMPPLVIFSFSLDIAMIVGFGAYAIRQVVRAHVFNVYLWAGTILLLVGRVLSTLQ